MNKRHLGIALTALGLLGILALLVFDLLHRKPVGGSVQWAALGGCILIAVLGAALLPLGDRPA